MFSIFFFHDTPPTEIYTLSLHDSLPISVVTLLAIAGTIEGLLSTSSAPAAWKYGVSAASAVFLVLYLARSEEHTSELQSRGHLVCRLLLEKKKKKQISSSPPHCACSIRS